ncbi:MAG: MarR family transcriptional regulator [Betaproteobacteria bacterium]|nr:MarR family transcriptional regulator [Betaproteobacteria bacterium]
MNDDDRIRMIFTTSLSQTARAYTSVADKIASIYGLSQATAWPAVMIGRMGNHTRLSELADALGLDPSSLVRIIDQLVVAGIVKRIEDPKDRRAKILSLTEEGEKIMAQVERALISFRNELLKDVPITDIQIGVRVLSALRASVKNNEIV